jgi:hypothetical protein
MSWLDELLPRIDRLKDELVECSQTIQGAALAWMAPHRLYGAAVVRDGARWCALLGESVESGVAGYGLTPEFACADFDDAWCGRPRAPIPLA